jgi:hypothetical protein
MRREKVSDMDGFELGTPALVCRWRLSKRHLPLQNRHMRALLARTVNGSRVSKELVAWAKQHIEWTLEQGTAENPNGVLMLIVDERGRAAMTCGPYVPLLDETASGLARRAERALEEAKSTSVAPEALWVASDDLLLWDLGDDGVQSGANSLVQQLAQTLGIPMRRYPGLAEAVLAQTITYSEVFLVSDEHGVVPASNAFGPHGQRMAQGYQRLLSETR